MRLKTSLKAGLIGLVAVFHSGEMAVAQDVLKVMRGTTTSSISVAMNRAIVMESDTPFAELSVANPSIAAIHRPPYPVP